MKQTAVMLNEVSEMGLVQPIDLIIEYEDNTSQRVGGLATVNEQRLQSLTSEELALLHQKDCFQSCSISWVRFSK